MVLPRIRALLELTSTGPPALKCLMLRSTTIPQYQEEGRVPKVDGILDHVYEALVPG